MNIEVENRVATKFQYRKIIGVNIKWKYQKLI